MAAASAICCASALVIRFEFSYFEFCVDQNFNASQKERITCKHSSCFLPHYIRYLIKKIKITDQRKETCCRVPFYKNLSNPGI